VHEVYRWVRDGERVVAVVSALAGTTNRLLERSELYGPRPEPTCLAGLVGTGELAAASLLGLALDRAGIPAEVLDAAALGLRTRGPILDAEPEALDTTALRAALSRVPVVVVPGFVGRSAAGSPTLLGRGGSDYTALFLAHRLEARRCRLLKDVDGVFDRDPASTGLARRYQRLSWHDAVRLGGPIVQPRALHFAERERLAFEVASLNSVEVTTVGGQSTVLASPHFASPRIRVGLLGLGVVGGGVYRALDALPGFDVVGIAVKDPRKERPGVPAALVTADAEAVVRAADVVVEAIGGVSPAAGLLAGALEAGRAVITANKAVVAEAGPRLEALARERGGSLRCSAAVGGAVPILAAAARLAPLASLTAVLNGTCNFVLDRMADGETLDAGVRAAQARGLAEADPRRDLDGTDSLDKLRVLARVAFGVELDAASIAREGIDTLPADVPARVARGGGRVKLVASLQRNGRALRGRVAAIELPAGHPLAQVRDEGNAALLTPQQGDAVLLRGKGAGRWPTTEAVVGDLLELAREAARSRDDVALEEVGA
jgi:homoserine dehydrogenase